mmetsp:Transcript_21890/g.55022  ORF Transcript_21890/g.55022 Transcript_21890/m.55022 type:complete len:161 (-) Transcript_21890:16-498(-)
MGEFLREPCPRRIWADMGGAFAMGCAGGTVFHLYKGMRDAPRGERLRSSFLAVRNRGPQIGGNFAIWGTLFSSFDCAISGTLGTEGFMNSIAAGAMTGGVLAMRNGMRAAGTSALAGGVLLGLIEGFSAVLPMILPKGGPEPEAPEMRLERAKDGLEYLD